MRISISGMNIGQISIYSILRKALTWFKNQDSTPRRVIKRYIRLVCRLGGCRLDGHPELGSRWSPSVDEADGQSGLSLLLSTAPDGPKSLGRIKLFKSVTSLLARHDLLDRREFSESLQERRPWRDDSKAPDWSRSGSEVGPVQWP